MEWVGLVGHYVFSCRYRESSRTKTYAWIMATANSRRRRRVRVVSVSRLRGGIIDHRFIVAIESN